MASKMAAIINGFKFTLLHLFIALLYQCNDLCNLKEIILSEALAKIIIKITISIEMLPKRYIVVETCFLLVYLHNVNLLPCNLQALMFSAIDINLKTNHETRNL